MRDGGADGVEINLFRQLDIIIKVVLFSRGEDFQLGFQLADFWLIVVLYAVEDHPFT